MKRLKNEMRWVSIIFLVEIKENINTQSENNVVSRAQNTNWILLNGLIYAWET